MKLRFHTGNRVDYLNTSLSTITSSSVIVLDPTGCLAIAVTDIPYGSVGTVTVGGSPQGSWELAKKPTDTFTMCQPLYWDSTNLYLTTTSAGNTPAGRADGVYAPGTTLAFVLLNRK